MKRTLSMIRTLISGKTLALPLSHFLSYKIFGIARLIGRLRNCRRYGETESIQNNHHCHIYKLPVNRQMARPPNIGTMVIVSEVKKPETLIGAA